jgi:hypothetical protein
LKPGLFVCKISAVPSLFVTRCKCCKGATIYYISRLFMHDHLNCATTNHCFLSTPSSTLPVSHGLILPSSVFRSVIPSGVAIRPRDLASSRKWVTTARPVWRPEMKRIRDDGERSSKQVKVLTRASCCSDIQKQSAVMIRENTRQCL